jgi:hypothetical protein
MTKERGCREFGLERETLLPKLIPDSEHILNSTEKPTF